MQVKNINGTSERDCKCGSWLEHWKKFSRAALPSWCCEKSCISKPTLGAHVQKDDPSDRGWYIVPLCDEHNKQRTSLELSEAAILVSANVGHTCGMAETTSRFSSGSNYSRW